MLGGLVTKGYDIFRIGAWATHIFVDKPEAAEYGKKYWGLPATVLPIDLDVPSSPNLGEGDGNPLFVFSKDYVNVVGLNGATSATSISHKEHHRESLISKLEVTLPSYSGKLTNNDPLLRYPLTISHLGAISLGKAKAAQLQNEITNDATLRSLLENAHPLISVNVSGATLVAGIPIVI